MIASGIPDYTLHEQSLETRRQIVKPEIQHFEPLNLIYVRATGRYDKAGEKAWGMLMPFAYSNQIIETETRLIGISHDDPSITEEDKLRYDACITCDADIELEGEVAKKSLPGGKYAVFLHKGPYSGLAATYKEIFNQWYPSSSEELREEHCFEEYLNRDPRRTKPENLRTKIFVPIK